MLLFSPAYLLQHTSYGFWSLLVRLIMEYQEGGQGWTRVTQNRHQVGKGPKTSIKYLPVTAES